VEVWVEAKNPKQELKPGTSVKLDMTAQTVKDALVVPASSIITVPDGTTAVMIAGSDGAAHQKAVKIGIRNGDDVQIVEGVTESDKVITAGAYGLPDKTKIKVAAPEAPAEGSEGGKPAADDSKDKPSGVSSEK
jgi:multidrug efflux pump subunit AcrA (membrane-fusion protein)